MSRASHEEKVPEGTIIEVQLQDNKMVAYDQFDNDVTDDVPYHVKRRCLDENMSAEYRRTGSGNYQWKMIPPAEYVKANNAARKASEKAGTSEVLTNTHTINVEAISTTVEAQESEEKHEEVVSFLQNCYNLKPATLKLPELTWRVAVRNVLRGENFMLIGDSGTGKTLLAQTLPKVLKRPFYYFNMGATQDARSTLIGNTHFNPEHGTFVAQAHFVSAIQTPNAIILLDELTRATPDAQNILLTVLDKKQRYLRIDEKPDTPTVEVAPGVTFIATANIGSEYTATRVLDRALLDRFRLLEVPHLDKETEVELLSQLFPTVDPDMIEAVAEIAKDTRLNVRSDNPTISTIISTRMTVEMASMLYDGFSLSEVAEVCVFPFYSKAGGPESERAYVKALVQRFTGEGGDNPMDTSDNDSDSMFG